MGDPATRNQKSTLSESHGTEMFCRVGNMAGNCHIVRNTNAVRPRFTRPLGRKGYKSVNRGSVYIELIEKACFPGKSIKARKIAGPGKS